LPWACTPIGSLSETRKSRDEAKLQLANGIGPGAERKANASSSSGADSFEVIAREWYEFCKSDWAPSHADKVIGRLVREVFPWIGSAAINEQGWNPLAIERQLAHVDTNGVKAAYNYAEYLDERKKMMQHWAGYLDSACLKKI
jgi:hypothetical protein